MPIKNDLFNFKDFWTDTWFVLYIANSLGVWLGWLWPWFDENLYDINMLAALFIGIGGVFTVLFPLILWSFIRIQYIRWSEKRYLP